MTPAFVARLSPAQSRTLAAVLALVAVLAVAAIVLVPVLMLHRHYDDAIASATDLLTRYRRIAAQAPELTKTLESVRERNGRRFYLRNTAANLASAELAEIVKAAIEGNGGRITTSQNVQPRDDEPFKQIGANVQFFATTSNLQKILAAIESQQPSVVVANITIRPVNAFRGFKPAPGQDPELVVQLDAVAWAVAEPERASSASTQPAPRPAPRT